MTGRDAVELCGLLRPRTVIPIHYEGWQHFQQGRTEVEQEFAHSSVEIQRSLRWLPLGVPTEITDALEREVFRVSYS
jgi:L-ascorbate metabolism protein UlaG (beta-lactamase superfamily)